MQYTHCIKMADLAHCALRHYIVCTLHDANLTSVVKLRQGSGKDRPQSLNPCLELTLKLVATHPPTTHHPPASLNNCLDKQLRGQVRQVEIREGV